MYDTLAKQVVASYLVQADCDEKILIDLCKGRIDTLHNTVVNLAPNFQIYEVSDYKLPRNYKSKRLIHQNLYCNNELALPLVYDINLFVVVSSYLNRQYKSKVNDIINYIFDEQYQNLDYGYGVVRESNGKFHSVGWSLHLPLYNDKLSTPYFINGLIHRVILLSRLNHIKVTSWVLSMVKYLEQYRLDEFRYLLAKELLPEVKNSYFMNGRHTSLNENRRKRSGRVIESTYYVYMMLSNVMWFQYSLWFNSLLHTE